MDHGTLRVSASVGVETLVVTFPAFTPQYRRAYAANVTITVSGQEMVVTLIDTNRCHTTAGCSATEFAAPSSSAMGALHPSTLTLGGVPILTPYIRSKTATTANFRGCIGVKFFSQLLQPSHYILSFDVFLLFVYLKNQCFTSCSHRMKGKRFCNLSYL